MTRALLLLLLACGGCLFVPKESTTTLKVQTKSATPWQPGPAGTVLLDAQPAGDLLVVHAIAPRVCTRLAQEEHTLRTDTHLDMKTADIGSASGASGPVAALFLIAAVPVLAVAVGSGVVSGIDVAASKPKFRTEVHARRQAIPCPVPQPSVTVTVRWPSGLRSEATTDADGQVRIGVPEDEVESGQAIVTGDGIRHAVEYHRHAPEQTPEQIATASPSANTSPSPDLQECKSRRSAAMLEAQQNPNLQERTAALLALPVCTR